MNWLIQSRAEITMRRFLIAIAIAYASCFSGNGLCQEAETDFRGEGLSSNYFDTSTGKLRSPVIPDNETLAERNDVIAKTANTTPTRPNWNLTWVGDLSRIIFITVGILFLLALVGLFVYLFRNGGIAMQFRSTTLSKMTQEELAVKVTQLPFEIESPNEGLFELCQKARAKGDYNRAIVLLFGHVLISLDQAKMVRLRSGKTNRMYLRELRSHSRVQQIYRDAMLPFEYVFFGRHNLSKEQFESVWTQIPEFEQLLQSYIAAQQTQKIQNAAVQSASAPLASGGLSQ